MSSSDNYPTKPTTGDLAHTITKVGLSAIPVIGGPAIELFQFLVQAPIERRRDIFVRQLGEKFLELEANGIKLENLQQNEQFISAVLQVIQTALRTHQAGKLAALRNAIANIAQGQSMDDTLIHVLLSHIDTLSEMHLRILMVFHAPKVPIEMLEDKNLGSYFEVLLHNLPELQDHLEIARQLVTDLNSRGLLNVELTQGVAPQELSRRRTTMMGEALLQLIAADDGKELGEKTGAGRELSASVS
jgi:hypothetical protein